EREYRHALALDPTLAEAAANLARLLRERGDRPGAAAVLDRALAGGAHAPEVFAERGLARAEGGDLAGAPPAVPHAPPPHPAAPPASPPGASPAPTILYEQLLRLPPSRIDGWKVLGTIYLEKLADRPAALRCFRRALLLETNAAEKAKLEGLIQELET